MNQHGARGIDVGIKIGQDASQESSDHQPQDPRRQQTDQQHRQHAITVPSLSGGAQFLFKQSNTNEPGEDQEKREEHLNGSTKHVGSPRLGCRPGAQGALDDRLVPHPVSRAQDKTQTQHHSWPRVMGVISRRQQGQVVLSPALGSYGLFECPHSPDLRESADTNDGGTQNQNNA